MAQNRQDKACTQGWEGDGPQEDHGIIHQLRQAAKAGEDMLGDAPVPPWIGGRREGWRDCSVQSVLPDPTQAMWVRCQGVCR